jgi:hypothetical protein
VIFASSIVQSDLSICFGSIDKEVLDQVLHQDSQVATTDSNGSSSLETNLGRLLLTRVLRMLFKLTTLV